jgi:hypothetical protein
MKEEQISLVEQWMNIRQRPETQAEVQADLLRLRARYGRMSRADEEREFNERLAEQPIMTRQEQRDWVKAHRRDRYDW